MKSRFFVIFEKWSGVDSQPVLSDSLWRKRTPCPPRRPWLLSLINSTRLSSQAIATLVRVPFVTRQAAIGVAVFGEGEEGGEGGGAGYADVRVAAPVNGGC